MQCLRFVVMTSQVTAVQAEQLRAAAGHCVVGETVPMVFAIALTGAVI